MEIKAETWVFSYPSVLWTDVVSWTLKSAAAALRLFTAGFQLCVFAISHLSPSLAASRGPGLLDAPPGRVWTFISERCPLSCRCVEMLLRVCDC